MIILAIESSCDETSIGIINDNKILCNVISSQIVNHQQFGGVVPELASRLHLSNITYVLNEALLQSAINLDDVDYVAYTATPGLIGCLHMGRIFAETIALFLKVPLIKVNHLYGHIYGARINHDFNFPALALLASGGHTQLFYMPEDVHFQIVGTTLDDAIGECYDKVGRILGLPYPAGAVIDHNASLGQNLFVLPEAKRDGTLDFSYSGLKSACNNLVHKMEQRNQTFNVNDFCCSFQKAAIDQLISKVKLALRKFSNVKTLILAGGVSANHELRKQILQLKTSDLHVVIPDLQYCTDNGAMIAQYAYCLMQSKNKEKEVA